jgi:bacteriochlorophyll 4-vinyl reductase
MSEARIGRILVASLHQAIADVLPDRLEFYENWLNARGLRRGTVGLAAISAVLSFLRTEGSHYPEIMRRAGMHAADWTLLDVWAVRRRLAVSLPRALRARAAVKQAKRVARDSYAGSRVLTRVRRGTIHVDLRGSLFCEVREKSDAPLCGFYVALFERLLDRYNVRAEGTIDSCRGSGDRACQITVRFGDLVPESQAVST